MTTDPKKNKYNEEELKEHELEDVAGGQRIPAPRAGKDMGSPQLTDDELEGVAGGNLGPGATDSPMPPRPPKRTDNLTESEAPD